MELKDFEIYHDPVFGIMPKSFEEYSKLVIVVICAGIIINKLKGDLRFY
jgi:hypothetical protein